MADEKLSALSELAAQPAADDEVYIRDVSEAAADESKSITTTNLLALPHADNHEWFGSDPLGGKDMLVSLVPFYYKQWSNSDGFTEAVGASGIVTTGLPYLALTTGATNGSKASVYSDDGFWAVYASSVYNYRFSLQIGERSPQTTQTMWFGMFETPAAPTAIQKHFGFTIENADIYATNAEGSTQTKTDTGVDSAEFGASVFLIKYMADNIKFYVNGSLVATHTTNRPDAVTLFPLLYIINTDTNDRLVWCYPLEILQLGE